jgi:hypothetical protein
MTHYMKLKTYNILIIQVTMDMMSSIFINGDKYYILAYNRCRQENFS